MPRALIFEFMHGPYYGKAPSQNLHLESYCSLGDLLITIFLFLDIPHNFPQ